MSESTVRHLHRLQAVHYAQDVCHQGLALGSCVVSDGEAIECDQSLRQQLFALLQLKVLRLVEGARAVLVNKTLDELFDHGNVALNQRELTQCLVLWGCYSGGARGLGCVL